MATAHFNRSIDLLTVRLAAWALVRLKRKRDHNRDNGK
jgi:hypothetical protein